MGNTQVQQLFEVFKPDFKWLTRETKNKVTTKDGDAYSLNDFESLSADEQKELINICDEKIQNIKDLESHSEDLKNLEKKNNFISLKSNSWYL